MAKKKLFSLQFSDVQQRLAGIDRAVAGKPMLLADEPIGNLHPDLGKMIMALLRDLNQNGKQPCLYCLMVIS